MEVDPENLIAYLRAAREAAKNCVDAAAPVFDIVRFDGPLCDSERTLYRPALLDAVQKGWKPICTFWPHLEDAFFRWEFVRWEFLRWEFLRCRHSSKRMVRMLDSPSRHYPAPVEAWLWSLAAMVDTCDTEGEYRAILGDEGDERNEDTVQDEVFKRILVFPPLRYRKLADVQPDGAYDDQNPQRPLMESLKSVEYMETRAALYKSIDEAEPQGEPGKRFVPDTPEASLKPRLPSGKTTPAALFKQIKRCIQPLERNISSQDDWFADEEKWACHLSGPAGASSDARSPVRASWDGCSSQNQKWFQSFEPNRVPRFVDRREFIRRTVEYNQRLVELDRTLDSFRSTFIDPDDPDNIEYVPPGPRVQEYLTWLLQFSAEFKKTRASVLDLLSLNVNEAKVALASSRHNAREAALAVDQPAAVNEIVEKKGRGARAADRKPRAPTKIMIAAYRLEYFAGYKTQKKIADELSIKFGKPISQGTVSRWIKIVDEWVAAGEVLPPILGLTGEPQSIDPASWRWGHGRTDVRPDSESGGRTKSPDPHVAPPCGSAAGDGAGGGLACAAGPMKGKSASGGDQR